MKKYDIPIVDNTTGQNKDAFLKLQKMLERLDDSLDLLHYNNIFREIIKEECAVRSFPTDGKGFSKEWIHLKTAQEKKGFIIKLIGDAITEMGFIINQYKDGYDYELEEAKEQAEYYSGLPWILD